MDVVKKLSFEDLSLSLTDTLAQAEPSGLSGVVQRLNQLTSSLESINSTLSSKVKQHKNVALQQLSSTGGRQAIEERLKAIKGNLKTVQMKEDFLEFVKENPTLGMFIAQSSVIDTSAIDQAIKAIKEQIGSEQEFINQTEERLRQGVQALSGQYEDLSSAVAGESRAIADFVTEFEQYQSNKPPRPPADAADAQAAVDDILRQIAQEEEAAAALERETAADASAHTEDQEARAALEVEIQDLERRVLAAQDERAGRRRRESARFEETLQWQETYLAVVEKLTGVSVLDASDPNRLTLKITQLVPVVPVDRQKEEEKAPNGERKQSAAEATTSNVYSSSAPSEASCSAGLAKLRSAAARAEESNADAAMDVDAPPSEERDARGGAFTSFSTSDASAASSSSAIETTLRLTFKAGTSTLQKIALVPNVLPGLSDELVDAAGRLCVSGTAALAALLVKVKAALREAYAAAPAAWRHRDEEQDPTVNHN